MAYLNLFFFWIKKIKYKVLFWGLDSLEDDQSTTEKDVASGTLSVDDEETGP